MKNRIEQDALLSILRGSAVSPDSVLVVHSAIARLSRKGYRAEAMIEALLEHVKDGTLVMPTMTWRTVTVDNPHWDEMTTPSHTGVLSEIFRTNFASDRSIHPTHSAAAYGKEAKKLVSRHHLDTTPVSPNSPYGLMRDSDTHILMIGVGLETCTAIHLPEEQIATETYLRPTVETYICTDRHGTVRKVNTRRHWRLDRDFPKFTAPLARKDRIQVSTIDDCPYILVSLRDLLDEVTAALAVNKNATLRERSQRQTSVITASNAR